MSNKRYGYNDNEHGTTIIWETEDGEPFTHVAEILDWPAWIRYMEHKGLNAK